MSLTTHTTPRQRLWNIPTSKARWFWLGGSLAFYACILAWYLSAVHIQAFPGPSTDPLRLFGIVAFVLLLGTAAYTLRRRFARGLPGRVQDWLWMHTWLGILTILIALLHENFAHITHDYCQNFSCLTSTYAGTAALYALIVLVLSGIIGRLLDRWQTQIIAHEASTNGVGIISAVKEHLLELEYRIERLCAGKSEAFQQYCMQALNTGGKPLSVGGIHQLSTLLSQAEQQEIHNANELLGDHARLTHSLQRQQHACTKLRLWRMLHILLATLSLLIICYHAIMELLTNVFHLIQAG